MLAVEENIPEAAVNFAMLNVENVVAYSQGVIQQQQLFTTSY